MNHKTNVNTTPSLTQANTATLALLQLNTLRQQLGDIGETALTAKALCEISYDEIDALRELGVANTSARLDALIKATHRNVVLIEESLAAMSLVLEEGATV